MSYETVHFNNDALVVVRDLPVGTTLFGSIFLGPGTPPQVAGDLTLKLSGSTIDTFSNYTISENGTTLTIKAAGVLDDTLTITYNEAIPGVAQVSLTNTTTGILLASAANASVTISSQACFAAGTFIRTSRGEVAVEDLRIGDMVLTTSGQMRPIVWLGRRDIDIRITTDPIVHQPIRIAADAFGPGLPFSDLTVSPGHALCVRLIDEVLVPAGVLVNGATIARLEIDRVTYWHVELDAHDILYANGLPAESYIDVGNRAFFADGARDPARTPADLADYCRPYVADGVLLQAMRAQLRRRTETLGWRIEGTQSVDLHILADGARIPPTMDVAAARFALPVGAKDVWLMSATSVPAHVGDSPDDRCLGVCLRRLSIEDDAGVHEIALDDPSLCIGFHGVEGAGGDIRRWTAGCARLPASIWQGARGAVAIRLELAAPPVPRWVAPADTTVVRDTTHPSLAAA